LCEFTRSAANGGNSADTLWSLLLKSNGMLDADDGNRFTWKRFLAYFVVIAIVKLIWPI
jgi:hypothetical protein